MKNRIIDELMSITRSEDPSTDTPSLSAMANSKIDELVKKAEGIVISHPAACLAAAVAAGVALGWWVKRR